MSESREITTLLGQWASGDRKALDELTRRVYAELRRLAAGYLRKERSDHTLQPTALVNQAYARLLEQKQTPSCQSRSHFFAIAAQLMRHILVDHARRRQATKRHGCRVPLDKAINLPNGRSADLLALDQSLMALEKMDPRKCKAVELHYFGGLTIEEMAEILQVSTRTVSRDLAFAEAWLHKRIKEGGSGDTGTLGAD
jgi:RNA polymerase sigma factor (TIGR02999 family)